MAKFDRRSIEKEQPIVSKNCFAHGCPLFGSIKHRSEWLCRFHYMGKDDIDSWGVVSSILNNHRTSLESIEVMSRKPMMLTPNGIRAGKVVKNNSGFTMIEHPYPVGGEFGIRDGESHVAWYDRVNAGIKKIIQGKIKS